MKQYNWTHEYQQRKKGIYEVRYLEFKGKVFYYNEALTKKMELEPSSFDSLLELFYFSYLPFDKFNTSRFAARYTPLSVEMLRKNSYIWKVLKIDSSWKGGTYQVPFINK